jgi:hypothetical protein
MFKKEGPAEVLEDVNKLINEVLTLVRSDIESQQISVRTELFDKLPTNSGQSGPVAPSPRQLDHKFR